MTTPATFPLARPATPERKPQTLALTLTIDPDNIVPGDLHLENGQIHWWDGAEAALQTACALFRFVKGEWFLNIEEGVPYFTHILVHNPNMRAIRALFKQLLLQVPGAASVPLLNLTRDRAARSLTVDFELILKTGVVLRSSDYPPFVLRLP